ncbi:glyoxalase family protein [Oceanobacillus picturae]|uniref:Glyoxalase family protein n=1 Tax=Oceanobacillus picturae TaxID=171693 RepID=A0A0U9HA68_9BACI|nr:VOC family protein [Oceanobacillus picturae]GAQ19591.1 glyoxalase family protein [Oceanobacillus picturae]
MIKGLYEAHLPVSNLKQSIEYYKGLGLEFSHSHEDRLAFFWIEKDKSWLGLWETDKVELDYHPSIRHIAFQVTLEGLKNSVSWLHEREYKPREAFGFKPIEPFVMAHSGMAHAKIHFNDPDGNSLEFICNLPNPKNITKRMYLSEWEELHKAPKTL